PASSCASPSPPARPSSEPGADDRPARTAGEDSGGQRRYAIPVTGAAPTRKGDMTEDLGYGWQGDLIDLPAYLKRIGHDGGLDPTPQTLLAPHGRNVTTIRFENVEIMGGRPVELSLDAVQVRLVGDLRGG